MHLNKEKKDQLHAELRVVRDHAEGACARIGHTMAEWRGIRAALSKTRAVSMAIREEAQQVRQQARLLVARSKERREASLIGLPSMQARISWRVQTTT
jgi:hypothetical protein